MSSHDASPDRPVMHHTRPWALVTGASGGIGEAFVNRLAAHGSNVVLAARSVDKLEAVAERARQGGVDAVVVPCDMGDRAARDHLLGEIERREITLTTLVNNAGYGMFGPFVEADQQRVLQMLEVNCAALTHLTGALLPGMVERRHGQVVNVASTAAFQPLPNMAAYAASKAYVKSFTEALWHELKGTGVRVIALCPGPTETDFFANAGDASALSLRRSAEQVVETCFRALAAGRPTVVDGPLNVAQSVAPRFVPTRVALAVAKRVVSR
ncbi:SDR family NAD(P)-dependent oxidoreductase [Aestuariimicrobium ganziense]|uniref:SDR family NAD(P)-dependent oxidoreductase n=1 Tax=Aestuariimicrobium ganziense TaxID=2773677 RepID=UPI00194398CD|nr:SDR family oxidoreductase [Aestuariimicrobium ganziense]